MEDLQYVKYSAKELLEIVTKKIDQLDEKVDALMLLHASLPSTYVTQAAMDKAQEEAAKAKRFAITSLIASTVGLAGIVGVIANFL